MVDCMRNDWFEQGLVRKHRFLTLWSLSWLIHFGIVSQEIPVNIVFVIEIRVAAAETCWTNRSGKAFLIDFNFIFYVTVITFREGWASVSFGTLNMYIVLFVTYRNSQKCPFGPFSWSFTP